MFKHKRGKLIFSFALILLALVGVRVCWNRGYYAEFTVGFSSANMPLIAVEIQNNTYLLGVDLGSFQQVEMHSHLLESMEKIPSGTSTWCIYNGSKFTSPKYIVPDLAIGPLKFKNVTVIAHSQESENETTIWKPPEKDSNKERPSKNGILGLELIRSMDILFDLKKGKIIATNNLSKLKAQGYNLENFLKFPMVQNHLGIIINVESDLGEKKLLLDTGFTYTTLHSNLYPEGIEKQTSHHGFPFFISNKFMIAGRDFGKKKLYFLDISDDLAEIDGILGMDFIKHHPIYIDFTHNTLYLQ